jgi:hypothetical protein
MGGQAGGWAGGEAGGGQRVAGVSPRGRRDVELSGRTNEALAGACVQTDQRKRYLGRFRDEIAAAEAYDEAARELFGEHARLNFPDGIDAFLAADGDVAAREAA